MSWNYRCPWLVLLFALLVACGQKMPKSEPDYATARKRMVEMQLASRGRDRIVDERVLEAMGEVPRHQFMPPEMREFAYADRPLPIGHDQTISQPFIVAFMTASLELLPTDRVLEIGTGSGYQAAVLSKLVKEVYSIEIVRPLGEVAEKALADGHYENVQVKIGDGYLGWPDKAPFDAIIVTCAPERIPKPLVAQLREGGRMVIPVGRSGGRQDLYVLEKKGGEMTRRAILPVRFVPMTGEGVEGEE